MRLIEQVLKEVALATDGVMHYGRGAKAYANIESPVYPRIWIHLVNPVDTIHINNSITSQYDVVGEITTTIPFTDDIINAVDSQSIYTDALDNMQVIYSKFITNLNKHPKNKTALGRVSRKEIIHEYDDNLVGYVFNFTIQLIENVNYQCN